MDIKQRIAGQQQQRAAAAAALAEQQQEEGDKAKAQAAAPSGSGSKGGRVWWAIEGTVHHVARPVWGYVPIVGGLVVRCVVLSSNLNRWRFAHHQPRCSAINKTDRHTTLHTTQDPGLCGAPSRLRRRRPQGDAHGAGDRHPRGRRREELGVRPGDGQVKGNGNGKGRVLARSVWDEEGGMK